MTDADIHTTDGVTETFETAEGRPVPLTQREIDKEIAELLAMTVSELMSSTQWHFRPGMIALRDRIEKLKLNLETC